MSWLTLPLPANFTVTARARFVELAKSLEEDSGHKIETDRLDDCLGYGATMDAAAGVLTDLAQQRWGVRVSNRDILQVHPPQKSHIAALEKNRVRDQELLKRDEQLRIPSVVSFIRRMEAPRERVGCFASIFNLMRDGNELATSLRRLRDTDLSAEGARSVINPYVQIITKDARDDATGLRLIDIWRYFRHTWSNQYTSVPGRLMLLLVRDRAAEFNPVIGIAALSSAIVQLGERDRWIGWRPDDILNEFTARPTDERARWLVSRIDRRRSEIYVDDLIRDELFWPSLWDHPNPDAEATLRVEAQRRRRDHQRFVRSSGLGQLDRSCPNYWVARAESDLYRSKRCLALADLLRAKTALDPYLLPIPREEGLRDAMTNRLARRAVRSIVRRAKADTVGTEIADLSVCGAVAPYNTLIGGKLISMLATSPTVVRAYHNRYRDYESEIASATAGRPISRASKLAYIGTTSLYGTTSSQYNRVTVPSNVLGADGDLRLQKLGRSRSFGTSHLSSNTVEALVKISEQRQNGARVNSLFGEGVNPKLRKVRAGLDALGWPSDDLLQHGRRRIIYGISLVDNLQAYLLGIDAQPRYLFSIDIRDDIERIVTWWMDRWLLRRLSSEDVLERVASNTLTKPVRHGARVVLPGSPLI